MADVQVGVPKRRLYPLLLLSLAKMIDGTTRFHKLMFILKQEYEIPIDQKFIRYHYGPFSSELRDDISFLVSNGLIEQDSGILGEDEGGFPIIKTTYRITKKGEGIATEAFSNRNERAKFEKVVITWNKKPLNEVIAHAKSLLQ